MMLRIVCRLLGHRFGPVELSKTTVVPPDYLPFYGHFREGCRKCERCKFLQYTGMYNIHAQHPGVSHDHPSGNP